MCFMQHYKLQSLLPVLQGLIVFFSAASSNNIMRQPNSYLSWTWTAYVNSLRPRWKRRHIADDIFKCIFLNENVWTLLKFTPKLVPNVRINNIPLLVQITAWRRPGDKPFSESMMVYLRTHICVTRPQWVRTLYYESHSQTVFLHAYEPHCPRSPSHTSQLRMTSTLVLFNDTHCFSDQSSVPQFPR